MSQPSKFAQAMKSRSRETPVEPSGGVLTENKPEPDQELQRGHTKPSRTGTKHIGGHFDPAVSKQLKSIAVEEDSSVQNLLAEALDMLFQSRQRPTIAQKPVGG